MRGEPLEAYTRRSSLILLLIFGQFHLPPEKSSSCRWVITAAHCLKFRAAVHVYFGVWPRNYFQKVQVVDEANQHVYVGFAPDTLANDIGESSAEVKAKWFFFFYWISQLLLLQLLIFFGIIFLKMTILQD